jgi:general secretion pathway protein K
MASGDVLRRLLEVVGGVDTDTAQTLSDRIMDWREPGDTKRLNGAKAEDYRAAGYTYGPRNGPFETVDEIKLVMGMTPPIFSRIASSLTVYAQTPSIDPRVAPRNVLLALPGVDTDTVDSLLQDRAARHSGEQRGGPASLGSLVGHSIQITALVNGPASVKLSSSATVRVTGFSTAPLWIYRAE